MMEMNIWNGKGSKGWNFKDRILRLWFSGNFVSYLTISSAFFRLDLTVRGLRPRLIFLFSCFLCYNAPEKKRAHGKTYAYEAGLKKASLAFVWIINCIMLVKTAEEIERLSA